MSNRDAFRVLVVDLDKGTGRAVDFGSPGEWLGGSGLAAALFMEYGLPDEAASHPDQPLVFAIGPLTGYFPLMSKVVLGFKSPYHQQYAEAHAGGRLALSLRFAGLRRLGGQGESDPTILSDCRASSSGSPEHRIPVGS